MLITPPNWTQVTSSELNLAHRITDQKCRHSRIRRCARFTITRSRVTWGVANETSNSLQPATTWHHLSLRSSSSSIWVHSTIVRAMQPCAWVSKLLVVGPARASSNNIMWALVMGVDHWIKAWDYHCSKQSIPPWISIARCHWMEWIIRRTAWVLGLIRWTQRTRPSSLWTLASMRAKVQILLTMSIRPTCQLYLLTMRVMSVQGYLRVQNFPKLGLSNMAR